MSETGRSSRGCCLGKWEETANAKAGTHQPVPGGLVLMFPRSFRAAVFFFFISLVFLYSIFGSGHLKSSKKFFSEKQYSSNLWLLFDYSNEPSLLKICLILEQMYKRRSLLEGIRCYLRTPALTFFSAGCWGSVVWTLRGSTMVVRIQGQPFVTRSASP